jgi:hypothetical protein
MKTNQEIQAEARQLAVLGSQFQRENSARVVGQADFTTSRVLMTFPPNPAMPTTERRIEATLTGGTLVYHLVERDAADREDTQVASSPAVYDVVSTGYELAEEERLAAELERYSERSEFFSDPADDETVAVVEAILETKSLRHADQLRTKAEVVEFLEGRLEVNALIERNIQRQCARESCREVITARHVLTVGEP